MTNKHRWLFIIAVMLVQYLVILWIVFSFGADYAVNHPPLSFQRFFVGIVIGAVLFVYGKLTIFVMDRCLARYPLP